jgi:hypothetical protein
MNQTFPLTQKPLQDGNGRKIDMEGYTLGVIYVGNQGIFKDQMDQ